MFCMNSTVRTLSRLSNNIDKTNANIGCEGEMVSNFRIFLKIFTQLVPLCTIMNYLSELFLWIYMVVQKALPHSVASWRSYAWSYSRRVSWSANELFSQFSYSHIRWEYLSQSMDYSPDLHMVIFQKSILVSRWTFQPTLI